MCEASDATFDCNCSWLYKLCQLGQFFDYLGTIQTSNIMGKHLMFTTSLIFEGNVSIGNNLRPMSSNLAPNWAKHCQTEAEVGIHLGFHWVSCESAFNCLDTSWDLWSTLSLWRCFWRCSGTHLLFWTLKWRTSTCATQGCTWTDA